MSSVAFITELFYPSLGGQEFRFLRLAEGLSKREFDVTVYTTDHTGGFLPKEDNLNGVRIVRYITLKNYVKPGSRSPTQLVKFVVATRGLLTKVFREYDAILINQMPILHLLFLPNKEEICVDWCEVYKKGALKNLIKFASKRFSKGTAVSEIVAEEIRQVNPHAKIEVIRTPINVDRYIHNGKKDPDLILYVGRLVPHKNILSLVDAIVCLNEKLHQRKKLVIIGDGPLKHTLIKVCRSYKYIEVLGKVEEERKIELLKRASILAIPSYREGFPNVVAEAIASTTPVLTVRSQLNNIHQFVEKYRIGFVAPSASPKHLAETIARINEKEWAHAITNETRLREKFREEVNVNKLIHYIRGFST